MGEIVSIYLDDAGQVADVQKASWERDDAAVDSPADFYDRATVERLLRVRLGISPPFDWIWRACSVERVLLVIAYALQRERCDRASAKAVALHALRGGYPIGDYRKQTLPGLVRPQRRGLETVRRDADAQRRADFDAQQALKEKLFSMVNKLDRGTRP